MTVVKVPMATGLITFSEQVGNGVPVAPNPYTDAQGLPTDVAATFDGFSNSTNYLDHTSTPDNYFLYGNRYGPGEVSMVTFNRAVILKSLWVSADGGGQLGQATVKGYLADIEQFAYTISQIGFLEITLGADLPVDTLKFFDYGNSWIDDIDVRAIPNPPDLKLIRTTTPETASLSWRGFGTLEETPVLNGDWTKSADQANPQTIRLGTQKFYRVVRP